MALNPMGGGMKSRCRICGKRLDGLEQYRVQTDRKAAKAADPMPRWARWQHAELYCADCWPAYAKHAAMAKMDAAREVADGNA